MFLLKCQINVPVTLKVRFVNHVAHQKSRWKLTELLGVSALGFRALFHLHCGRGWYMALGAAVPP